MPSLLPEDIAHELKALGDLHDNADDVRVLSLAIAAALSKVDLCAETFDVLLEAASMAADDSLAFVHSLPTDHLAHAAILYGIRQLWLEARKRDVIGLRINSARVTCTAIEEAQEYARRHAASAHAQAVADHCEGGAA